MIKTFIVDGDKGGVGKSTVARFVADSLLNSAKYGNEPFEALIVVDADPSNADVCGEGGFTNETFEGTEILAVRHPIREANDWIELINHVEEIESNFIDRGISNIAMVFSLPAAAGLVIVESPEIAKMMSHFNATQVWVLGNEESSIEALQRRYDAIPMLYENGIAVRNLKHGPIPAFEAWNNSELKNELFNLDNSWVELDFPVLQSAVSIDVGRAPVHQALKNRIGANGKRLGLGSTITLETFRQTVATRFNKAIEELAAKMEAQG